MRYFYKDRLISDMLSFQCFSTVMSQRIYITLFLAPQCHKRLLVNIYHHREKTSVSFISTYLYFHVRPVQQTEDSWRTDWSGIFPTKDLVSVITVCFIAAGCFKVIPELFLSFPCLDSEMYRKKTEKCWELPFRACCVFPSHLHCCWLSWGN